MECANPQPSLTVLEYELEQDGTIPIKLCRCYQRDGSSLWAIRRLGSTLNRNYQWEYEPIPSSRDDGDYMQMNRYATTRDAMIAYRGWKAR
jgi:hypothetical protein